MKNINLLPANCKEKFYIYNYFKKALTIIVSAFLILILIVFLLRMTSNYLNKKVFSIESNINNKKYVISEMAFKEKTMLEQTNFTLSNIINAINKDDYNYTTVLNSINNCFNSKNITIVDLEFVISYKKIILTCSSQDKEYIPPIIVKLNSLDEIRETNVVSFENDNKPNVAVKLELILK